MQRLAHMWVCLSLVLCRREPWNRDVYMCEISKGSRRENCYLASVKPETWQYSERNKSCYGFFFLLFGSYCVFTPQMDMKDSLHKQSQLDQTRPKAFSCLTPQLCSPVLFLQCGRVSSFTYVRQSGKTQQISLWLTSGQQSKIIVLAKIGVFCW